MHACLPASVCITSSHMHNSAAADNLPMLVFPVRLARCTLLCYYACQVGTSSGKVGPFITDVVQVTGY